ncbi:MAG: ABC transporter ATP-binding protein [Candidatus Zixiibacteriota bacterium]
MTLAAFRATLAAVGVTDRDHVMAAVEFISVDKSFDGVAALLAVSFRAAEGEFLVIVGPSGCGKSTILRLIAGLEIPDSGSILIDGEDVAGRPPRARGCAMVFQSYALYPHWSVFDNLAFPLRIRRVGRSEIARRVREIAASLRLTDQLAKRPRALSGGQRQRIALGRAIAADPRILLFDEPLSNLDAPLRAEMRQEIVARQKALGRTALYVTHDQTEALTMGDRVLVLNGGITMGCGTPTQLYDDPPNRFVAAFLGRPTINLLAGGLQSEGDALVFAPLGSAVPPELTAKLGSSDSRHVEVGIRPEHVRLVSVAPESPWRVLAHEFLGDRTHYSVGDGRFTLTATGSREAVIPIDTPVRLDIARGRMLFFDPVDGRRLA